MRNVLDTEVSYFRSNQEKGGTATVNLLTFLRSTRHLDKLTKVRSASTEVEKDFWKGKLPCITPHGVIRYGNEKTLVKHSGVIAGDIDTKGNPWLTDAGQLVRELANIENVAYAGKSASGKGVWFIVPIADPSKHEAHYSALIEDFKALGITLDTAVRAVGSFRYYCYDPDAYFNPQAVIYENLKEYAGHTAKAIAGPSNCANPSAIRAANTLIQSGQSFASNYNEYFKIAAACKYEFGPDEGKEIALSILCHSPEFSVSDYFKHFDTEWEYIKRESGYLYTGKHLVDMERSYLKKTQKPQTQPTTPLPPPTIQAPPPAPISTGGRIETYTSRLTGKSFAVKINENGYPAAWDERQTPAEIMQAAGWIARPPLPLADDEAEQWAKARQRAKELANWTDYRAGKIPYPYKPWINTGPLATVRVTSR